MKHCIIVKFDPDFDYVSRIGGIKAIFDKTLLINGVNSVSVKRSNSERENRYHLMIEIDMEKPALEEYDASAPHREWKETYGAFIKSKAIFDYD